MMRISVVIPLFNADSTILSAINSVLSQTFLPIEIIVVNDGSKDNSLNLVSEMENPLIRILTQPNSGVSSARNKGVEISKGDWIAFLDADDIWFDDHLERFRLLSEKYPDCQILAGVYLMQYHNGIQKRITINKLEFDGEDGILNNYFEVASCSHPPLHSSSIAVKRSAILSSGGFPAGIKSGEDLLTWARLAVNNRIAYTKHPISIFILDPSHTYNRKPNRIPQIPDIVGNELSKLSVNNKEVPGIKEYTAHWHKMRASIFLRLGMKKQASGEIFRSLIFNPYNFKIYLYFLLLLLPNRLINPVFRKTGNP